MSKSIATLAGVEIAALSSLVWRFQSGVSPYTTVIEFDEIDAPKIESVLGSPVTLFIQNSDGVAVSIEDVYPLHRLPAGKDVAAFLVADKRWTWNRNLIARDFNIPKRTGGQTAFYDQVPDRNLVTVDQYDYTPWSIKDDGTRYTAREALELVLGELTGDDFDVVSFPFDNSPEGEVSLQNVTLRDPGDSALGRLLAYIPGARVFVRADGRVVVYDATDTNAVRDYISRLPETTWSGDVETWVDRRHVRPSEVRVHYQREVELPVEFSDDYAGNTSGAPNPDAPFLENVIPTVDPETRNIAVYDPELRRETVRDRVPPGTWVEVSRWLEAMDADRPTDGDGNPIGAPWTFETLRNHWASGTVDGVLLPGGRDLNATANTAARVQAIKTHFRQTFRISRRYMDRIRSLRNVEVTVLDPVTGARAPSRVWGQACIRMSQDKFAVARGGNIDDGNIWRNVDWLAPSDGGEELVNTSPGPARITILDADLGVFRVEWTLSAYGTEDGYIPCNLVGEGESFAVPKRDLALQDTEPMTVDSQVENGANGLYLAKRMRMKAILTVVPASPNSAQQFHRVDIAADEVAERFQQSLGVTGGSGPAFELFISPNEETARFAIEDTDAASISVRSVLGLIGDGLEPGQVPPGYRLANTEETQDGPLRHLRAHAVAAAAEVLVPFNDSHMGVHVTGVPADGDLALTGNLGSTSIRVSQHPDGVVDATHEIPPQGPPASRFALLPESSRVQILGVLPFK